MWKKSLIVCLFLLALDGSLLYANADKIELVDTENYYTKSTKRYNELLRLVNANPFVDLKKAIAKKDYRLIAIRRYLIVFPFLEKNKDQNYREGGYRIIEGTSDYFQSYEHEKLNKIAYCYAFNYNWLLSEYIDEKRHSIVSEMLGKSMLLRERDTYKTVIKVMGNPSDEKAQNKQYYLSYLLTLSNKRYYNFNTNNESNVSGPILVKIIITLDEEKKIVNLKYEPSGWNTMLLDYNAWYEKKEKINENDEFEIEFKER